MCVCVCVALLNVYDVIFMRSPISVNSSIYPLAVQVTVRVVEIESSCCGFWFLTVKL